MTETAKIVPVSRGQRRLWFVDRLAGGAREYNVVLALRLHGDLDVDRLTEAISGVVARQEALRSRFMAVDGEPVMIVDPPSPVVVERVHGDLESVLAEAANGVDLSVGPIARFWLAEPDCTLVVGVHHIVFDGWSASVFVRDLAALYSGTQAPDLAAGFADYAVWQHESGLSPDGLAFWRDTLRDAPAVLDLPLDRPRPVRRSGAGERIPLTVSPEVTGRLAAVCRERGATTFMGLLGALNVVIGRYCGTRDVVVGTLTSDRVLPELEDLVGFFVNTVALRTDLSGDPGFGEVVARSRVTALEAFGHQDVPFDRVVEEVSPQRAAGVTPYVQVAVALQNVPEPAARLGGGVTATPVPVPIRVAAFDLSVQVWPEDGGLTGFVEYATELFDRPTIDGFVTAFQHALAQGTAEPSAPISRLILTAPEPPAAEPPPARCLHDLVADVAARTPEAIAATCAGSELTYADLDRRARRLAHTLKEHGVGPGSIVGVCLPRSLDVPVALLAVLHAGAAYLPLEADYPAERLAYMIEDSGARVVIGAGAFDGVTVVSPGTGPGEAPALDPVDPEALAYVIYTSGSTGRPKGVGVAHSAVACRVHEPDWLPLGAHEVFMLATPLSFDVSVLELFGCLVNGHTLAILPAGKALPERVAAFLADEPVTVTWLTAALFHAVVDCAERPFPTVRHLIAGGDQLSADHVARAAALVPGGQVMNGYGPTEATIFTTTYDIPRHHSGRVPIGTALPFTGIHIMGPGLSPAPPGVIGELLVSGAGLARGYLGRPALTAERFVPDPGTPGGRLYRTGDLVRRRGDGLTEFLGRADQQVKIRGFRVELEEIEQVLRRHPGIRDVVVTAPEHDGDRRVIAYVVPAGEGPSLAEVLRHCRDALPDYMVPALVVTLAALPVSPNGKVDRAALPRPASDRPALEGYVPPRGHVQRALADLWTTLLRLDRIGAHDHFFDVGGHSLLASRLLARVRKTFACEVPLADFLATPTVAALADLVQDRLTAAGSVTQGRPALARAAHNGTVPVSPGQRRLWFVDRLAGGAREYEVVLALRLSGDVDVDRLVAAVSGVVARQEALRSRFIEVDGEPVMVVDPPAPVTVERVHGPVEPVLAQAAAGVDLSVGPVARFWLVEPELTLVVGVHHIVFDGWSGSVFLHDLAALYAGQEPPPLTAGFADFAVWEHESGVSPEALDFWRETLRDAPPVLDLPLDRARPARRTWAADRVPVRVPARVIEAFRRAGATPFMGVLAGLNVVLARACRTTDVIVGTFTTDRAAPELEDLVGFFVNTVALRTDLSGDPGFGEVLARSRAVTVAALACQGVPFDRVVEEVAPARAAGVTPFVQVAVVVQNTPEAPVELAPGVRIEAVPVPVTTSAFDLSLQLWPEPDGGMTGFAEYSTELFDRPTVESVVTALDRVLDQGTADPAQPMAAISLAPVSASEFAARDAGTGLAETIAARAARTPDGVAFRAGADVLTYRDLDRRARAVADRLRARGAGPETVIGVRLPPGLDLPVAVVGILYAGAAYLPLDPAHPAERLSALAEDAGALLVLTEVADEVSDTAITPADPENVACVIFTSGSTGRPKGVAITGRSLLNRLGWMREAVPFLAGEVSCQKTPIAFVDSLWELLGPLTGGMASVVLSQDAVRDPQVLVDELADAGVSRVLIVPSLLRVLLRTVPGLASRLPNLTTWVSSGEPLTRDVARLFAELLPGRLLLNLYGSSEAWDALCPDGSPDPREPASGLSPGVPVGRPIAGVRAVILDEGMRPVPDGFPGELYVGGRALARGYLNRPGLTAGRFLPDPAAPGARLYRTGDLARVRADGQVELLGRTDHQVKIRGARVEPGEVEAALEELAGVRQAAVVAVPTDGGTELVGHVVAPRDPFELRRELAGRLPAHLVPARIAVHDALPRTATGKIDRRALMTYRTEIAPESAAMTDLERRIAAIWAEELGREVGPHEDFFDVGGHSLLAPVLVGKLAAELSVELPLSWLFDHPTVHAMSMSPQLTGGPHE
ncbi:non-ribosomal peptide synthetase [Herbidospora mongoliensis]|uniref:non-ribosomal peptide synthetase n=1 Tax=Herbidospora mongoliensis TaxID=688067 RepID=UPI00082E8BA5|nr:non-ribosomal peptide synthetase [Herbidospora mongoliensis]